MKIKVLAVVAASALSGCIISQTDSGFKTPLAGGTLSGNSNVNVDFGSDVSFLTGNTYGYQAGAVEDEGFQAYAGIVPGASVTTPPVSGTATMSGRYEVAEVSSIFQSGGFLNGFSSLQNGSITLTADFDDNSLIGSNGRLSVDGAISGDQLSGRATWDGVSGPLTGLVGSNEAIGVFHGSSESQVHAGGFIVN